MTTEITWAAMSAAGVDITRVEQRSTVRDHDGEIYDFFTTDGATRLSFGRAIDPGADFDEGEHTGWDAAAYELEPVDGEDGEFQWVENGCQWHFEAGDIAGLFAKIIECENV